MGAEGIIGLPVPTACSYQRIIVFWVRYDDLMESDVPTTIAEVCEHLDSSRGDLAVEQIEIDMGMGQVFCHGSEGYGHLGSQCIIRRGKDVVVGL